MESLQKRENISEAFSEMMQKTPQNVHGFSIGYKIKDGKQTGERCVRYHVRTKMPKEKVAEHDLIPEFVSIDGEILKTDVVERSYAEFLTSTADPTCARCDGRSVSDPVYTTKNINLQRTANIDTSVKKLCGVCLPVSCSTSGNLPAGLSFVNTLQSGVNNWQIGRIQGAPTVAGNFVFTVTFNGEYRNRGPSYGKPTVEIITINVNVIPLPGDGGGGGSPNPTPVVTPTATSTGNLTPSGPVTDCFDWKSEPPENPIPAHRAKKRPLMGGINITPIYAAGHVNNSTITGTQVYNLRNGTLGGIVVDNETNTLVGLTNAHVIIKDYLYSHYRTNQDEIYNIYDNVKIPVFDQDSLGSLSFNNQYLHNYDQVILQDDTYTNVNISEASIGRPKRYVPAKKSLAGCLIPNKVDAALLTLNSKDLLGNGVSNLQFGLGATGIPFASSQEIDSSLGKIAASSGATTGPKDEACDLTITALNTFITLNLNSPGSPGDDLCYYGDLIEFNYSDLNGASAYGGDSGSFLLAKFENQWKVIGLVFAANISETLFGINSIGYACRIDRVAEKLNIRAWNGQENLPVDGPNKGEIVHVELDFKESKFENNGKIYHQAGVRNNQNYIVPTGNFIEDFSCDTNDLVCNGYDPGFGLQDHIVEAIYVHSAGDLQYAVCGIPDPVPSGFTGIGGIVFGTDHSQVVYLGENRFPAGLFLPSGLVTDSDIDIDLRYSSTYTGQQLLSFCSGSSDVPKSGMSVKIASGESGVNFFISPAIDNPNQADLSDAEQANLLFDLKNNSSWYTNPASFLVVESGSVPTGGPFNPLDETKNPCGGGHICNRASFDIKISTPLISGVTVLAANLNNGGSSTLGSGTDPGPGPFPFDGPKDRYSSTKITKDVNELLFGTGVRDNDPNQPLSYSVEIAPSAGNNNPHGGITWVRILNPCFQPIYSCCLSNGGGTTAPPGWTPGGDGGCGY